MSVRTLKQQIESRVNEMKDDRTSFVSQWKELDEYIKPKRGRFDGKKPNDGTKENFKIVNSVAGTALDTLSSGMVAGITSPARPWFSLSIIDKRFSEMITVKQWLQTVEELMRDVFLRSNLYQVLPKAYSDLGQFGSSSFSELEDSETVVRFYHYVVGEYYLGIDHREVVNAIAREIQMTVGQVVEKWGIGKVSTEVKIKFDKNELDDFVDITNYVGPNNDAIPDSKTFKGMPFISVYYETGKTDTEFLDRSGFREFPVMSPRWLASSGDSYGTDCPGMTALGDCKQLQLMEKRKLQAIDKKVNPPLKGSPGIKKYSSNVTPGGITFVNNDEQFEAVYKVDFSVREVSDEIQNVSQRINTTFFADLFLMMTQSDRREITAREIDERHEEKLTMLGPVLESLNDSLLDPLIERTFAIMLRRGLIPPPPPEIAGSEIKIEYISALAQAQKSVGLSAVDRLMAFAGQTAGLDPTILDNIDFDNTLIDYAERLGAPPDNLRPTKEVENIRIARIKQQQEQAEADALEQAAATASTAAQVPLEGEETLATRVIDNVGEGTPV